MPLLRSAARRARRKEEVTSLLYRNGGARTSRVVMTGRRDA